MILKIEYKITFPFKSIFSISPKIIFLRNIYASIKGSTCFYGGKCDECKEKNSCIFYHISGQSFNHSEGLCVEMNEKEPVYFARGSHFNLKFYLIGNNIKYQSFITEYFRNNEFIENNYFQKNVNEIVEIEDKIVEGKYYIKRPVEIDNIKDEINFINKNYEMNINNDFTCEIIEDHSITDHNGFRICGKRIKYYGFKGIVKLVNCSYLLTLIGVGKTMMISGGKADEIKN